VSRRIGRSASGGRLAPVSSPNDHAVLAPVTFRPRRIRTVCWVLAPVVFVALALLGTALTGSTGSGTGVFQRSDQIAMIGLGLLAAAGILLFTRPKVTADANGVRIRNVIGGYDLPWQVVRAVRFERGNPWASLELLDDDVVAVMAIQAADKQYAVTGVRALRALLAAHQTRTSARTTRDHDGAL
jgi:Bacterial PH domain